MRHICPIFNEFERSDFIAVTKFGEIKIASFSLELVEWDAPVIIIGPESRAKRYERGTFEMIEDFAENGIGVKLNSHADEYVKWVTDEHLAWFDAREWTSLYNWK